MVNTANMEPMEPPVGWPTSLSTTSLQGTAGDDDSLLAHLDCRDYDELAARLELAYGLEIWIDELEFPSAGTAGLLIVAIGSDDDGILRLGEQMEFPIGVEAFLDRVQALVARARYPPA